MLGTQLSASLHQLHLPQRPQVLLVTPRSTPEDVLKAAENGVAEYLILPYSEVQLLKKVRHAARRSVTRAGTVPEAVKDVPTDAATSR